LTAVLELHEEDQGGEKELAAFHRLAGVVGPSSLPDLLLLAPTSRSRTMLLEQQRDTFQESLERQLEPLFRQLGATSIPREIGRLFDLVKTTRKVWGDDLVGTWLRSSLTQMMQLQLEQFDCAHIDWTLDLVLLCKTLAGEVLKPEVESRSSSSLAFGRVRIRDFVKHAFFGSQLEEEFALVVWLCGTFFNQNEHLKREAELCLLLHVQGRICIPPKFLTLLDFPESVTPGVRNLLEEWPTGFNRNRPTQRAIGEHRIELWPCCRLEWRSQEERKRAMLAREQCFTPEELERCAQRLRSSLPKVLSPALRQVLATAEDAAKVDDGISLTWQWLSGEAEVLVAFAPKMKRTIRCTTIQMLVMQAFNSQSIMTTSEIRALVRFDTFGFDRHFLNHLLSLTHPKAAVLLKRPNSQVLRDTDKFCINWRFEAPEGLIFRVPLLKFKN